MRARSVVEGVMDGLHRSPYFGQSVEFSQHREYVPGDEARHIDWKVWSKTDRYYVKLFEEDTNLRTTLLVDGSESMSYGSGAMTKADYAATLAAAIAYLLLKQQDSVGMTVFGEGVRASAPHRGKKTHLNTLLGTLGATEPADKTDLGGILARTAEEQRRPGMVVLFSDLFADREATYRGLRMLRSRGHDVLVFHVLDDEELDFDFQGTTRFVGMEDAGEVTCDPRSLKAGYLQAMNDFCEETRKRCAANLIDYQVVRTSEPFDAALSRYINSRLGFRKSVRR
ncbi:DUF58 domain-containing protein [Alienimonas sp. DA493]|uniref:DUF58 domain-containing protein n=1 Tax=Alienimonas sp. DA493 TaxID=3373605 RepID=UPI003753F52F